MKTREDTFIWRPQLADCEELLIQPLGCFGDPSFTIPAQYESTKGRAFAFYGEVIYFSGGEKNPLEFGSITVDLKLKKGTNSFLNNMKEERGFHQMVALNHETIFVLGGISKTKESYLASCEKYQAKEKTWNKAADLLIAKCGMGTAVFNERWIYIFGGYINSREYSTSIEGLDAYINKWLYFKLLDGDNLGQKQGSLAIQINRSSILVFGVEDAINSIPTYIFDTTKKKLKKLKETTEVLRIESDFTLPVGIHHKRIFLLHPTDNHGFAFFSESEEWRELQIANS